VSGLAAVITPLVFGDVTFSTFAQLQVTLRPSFVQDLITVIVSYINV
jgi:hypothetical protein